MIVVASLHQFAKLWPEGIKVPGKWLCVTICREGSTWKRNIKLTIYSLAIGANMIDFHFMLKNETNINYQGSHKLSIFFRLRIKVSLIV